MTKTKIVLGAIAILVVGFVLGVLGTRNTQNGLLAGVDYDVKNFVGDVYQGLNGVLMMRNGQFVGPINSNNSSTISATTTLSAETYVNKLVLGTGITTLTPAATTTLTAAQACGGSVLSLAPTVANATMTLPTAQTLQSTCLLVAGNSLIVPLKNASGTSNYNVVAGTGGTLYRSNGNNSTSTADNTISSSTPGWVRITLTLASSSDSTYDAFLLKYLRP